jgi:hypothetical protein
VQPRTTAILLAVAVALGAFVYFYEIRGGEARKEAEARAKRLFPGVEADAVDALAFRTSDARDVRLERREGAWRVVEPVDFPADAATVDGLARGLAELASEGVIEEPQAAEVYGLGGDTKRVRFRAGGQERELRIGKRAPVGGQTYAAAGEDARVYTVPSYRVTGFEKALPDLRERLVLRFDQPAIRRIEARWPPDGRVVLAREGEGPWRLLEPLEGEADAETVDGLLSDLRFLRASEFLDDPPPAARAALERPEFEVRLEAEPPSEGAGAPVFELRLGGLHDGGRVVASSQESILYTVPPERLQDLPRELTAYRYKELAEFPILDAQTVELAFRVPAENQAEAVVIRLERGEAGWTSSPEMMQPGRAARLVSELSRLEARDIVADRLEAAELEALGLAPPQTVVRVLGKPAEAGGEAPELAEVELGVLDPERGIAARTPERETVYRLDPALAEHVPVSLEAFRERFRSEEEAKPEGGETSPRAEEEAEAAEDE